MRFTGAITRSGGAGARLQGTAQLDAPDLRTTLHWLAAAGFPALEVPTRVLHRARLKGEVAARAGEIVFAKLRGDADGSGVTGSLALRPGRPSAVSAELSFERLNSGSGRPWRRRVSPHHS